jgi:hypothetical protein
MRRISFLPPTQLGAEWFLLLICTSSLERLWWYLFNATRNCSTECLLLLSAVDGDVDVVVVVVVVVAVVAEELQSIGTDASPCIGAT